MENELIFTPEIDPVRLNQELNHMNRRFNHTTQRISQELTRGISQGIERGVQNGARRARTHHNNSGGGGGGGAGGGFASSLIGAGGFAAMIPLPAMRIIGGAMALIGAGLAAHKALKTNDADEIGGQQQERLDRFNYLARNARGLGVDTKKYVKFDAALQGLGFDSGEAQGLLSGFQGSLGTDPRMAKYAELAAKKGLMTSMFTYIKNTKNIKPKDRFNYINNVFGEDARFTQPFIKLLNENSTIGALTKATTGHNLDKSDPLMNKLIKENLANNKNNAFNFFKENNLAGITGTAKNLQLIHKSEYQLAKQKALAFTNTITTKQLETEFNKLTTSLSDVANKMITDNLGNKVLETSQAQLKTMNEIKKNMFNY